MSFRSRHRVLRIASIVAALLVALAIILALYAIRALRRHSVKA